MRNRSTASADPILGSAGSFAVLGSSTVVNTGPSTVGGDLGVSPGTAVVGFPPGIVTPPGTIHAGDAVAAQARSDANTAFIGLMNMPYDFDLTGQDLGGQTLISGVYNFDSSAQLTGALTLDAQFNNNAYWVFQIGSALTTASGSSVNIINVGSDGGTFDGLFWQVGSSATLGTTTAFEGNIIALASITLNTGATLHNARVIALNGAVTLDTNTINIASPPPNMGAGLDGGVQFDGNGNVVPVGPTMGPGGPPTGPGPGAFAPVPEPASIAAWSIVSTVGAVYARRRRRREAQRSQT